MDEDLEVLENLKCHHCGESCNEEIIADDLLFCCYGCKAVHELLTDNDLDQYYTESSLQTRSWSPIKGKRKYAFLDKEDIKSELLYFQEEDISVITFFLPGIHCSSCIFLLEHLPRIEKNVIRSEVNFLKREVKISFNNSGISLRNLAVLLSQLGYPPDISLQSLDKTKSLVLKPDLGVKIAVAGFCFGNAMLMSMPEYLDSNALLTEDFKSLFSWINFALTLPVILYSGRDYFIRGFKSLRSKSLNIDVPIALGIMALFGRSSYEILTQSGPGYVDSLTGLVFFLLVGKWYQNKTYQALSFERDYTSYFPVSIFCLVNGEEVSRPLKDLKKGDLVLIHNDELIPADGVILDGEGSLDYSFVTGESTLIEKAKGSSVFAGGRQKGRELKIRLSKSVNNSELTQLWNSETFQNKSQSLSNWIDRISQYFTLAIIAIAVGTGIYWWLVAPELMWNAITAVLIVACPCALALTLPFAYGYGMRILGKAGLYLKGAHVIESLASIKTIVFDKTGTLTKSYAKLKFHGESLSVRNLSILKSTLSNSAHPLSRIIYNELSPSKKIPLTSFTEHIGKGFEARINGSTVKVGSAEYLGLNNKASNQNTRVHIYIDAYLGYFEIPNIYRDGIFKILETLRSRYHTYLLSGDNSLEKERLAPYFQEIYFNQKPKDKLNFISKIPNKTLMIGDGLNDAGGLKSAEVGIAVSEDVHQFSPSCDAILNANNLLDIPRVLTFSKAVLRTVFIGFGISFLYNIVGLSFAVTGHLTPLISAILMPLSSVSVVLFISLSVQAYGKMLTSKV